jgi:hypothetical protein
MAQTQFSWQVTNLFTIDATLPNYVVSAYYNVIGVNGDVTQSISNVAQFEIQTEQPNYVPYDQLTNDIVVGWIQAELGVDGIASIEACINGMIETIQNPPITPTNQPLPWA